MSFQTFEPIFSELSIKSGGVFIKGSNPVYVTEDDLMRFLHEHLVAKFCDLIAAGYDDSHEKIIQGKTYTVGPFTEDDVVALAIIPEDFQDGAIYVRALDGNMMLVLCDTPANEEDNVLDRLHATGMEIAAKL